MLHAPARLLMSLSVLTITLASSGCELIASFDRDKIPKPELSVPDAALLPPGPVIEGGLPMPEGGMDAGLDAGMDASSSMDASTVMEDDGGP